MTILPLMGQADPLIQPKTNDIVQPHGLKLIDFKSLPGVKQGVAYDAENFTWNALTTIDVATWKALAIEIGAAGDAEPQGWKMVGVLSVDLLHLGDWIKFPILDKIVFRPGVWFGANLYGAHQEKGESSVGISFTALEFRF